MKLSQENCRVHATCKAKKSVKLDGLENENKAIKREGTKITKQETFPQTESSTHLINKEMIQELANLVETPNSNKIILSPKAIILLFLSLANLRQI